MKYRYTYCIQYYYINDRYSYWLTYTSTFFRTLIYERCHGTLFLSFFSLSPSLSRIYTRHYMVCCTICYITRIYMLAQILRLYVYVRAQIHARRCMGKGERKINLLSSSPRRCNSEFAPFLHAAYGAAAAVAAVQPEFASNYKITPPPPPHTLLAVRVPISPGSHQ